MAATPAILDLASPEPVYAVLRRRRLALGLPMYYAAALFNVGPQTLHRIETGKRELRDLEAIRFDKILRGLEARARRTRARLESEAVALSGVEVGGQP